MGNVREFAITQEGNDRFVVNGIVYKIIVDIMEVCRNNPKSFKEELKIGDKLLDTEQNVLMVEDTYFEVCDVSGKEMLLKGTS
ncbi:MAG: hypothetical protein R3Y54_12595 [Eubacteriales bacterium]